MGARRGGGLRSSFFCCALLLAVVAHAEDVVQIHGFGAWSYGKTDHNVFLGGTEGGDYRSSDVSLNVTADAGDRIRINVQEQLAQTGEGSIASLTYAFAEFRFSDALRIRAGQVKLPFGNYAEIIHVGTLRPFLAAPQGVYGPIGIAGEDAYKGIGITGFRPLRGGWELRYDAYAGGLEVREFDPPEAYLVGESVTEEGEFHNEATRNLVGGRVVIETPISGLNFGVSGYRGSEIEHEGDLQRWVADGHIEYDSGKWLIRSELVNENVKRDLIVHGFYVETAYRVTSHWQLAAQYNNLTTDVFEAPHPSEPSLLDHREVAEGINYWFAPNFVWKLAFHHVNGNRFAGPAFDEYESTISSGHLHRSTNLIQFGVNFSF